MAQVVDPEEAREFEEKARAIHVLPYSERWDLGQEMVDRLNELIGSRAGQVIEGAQS